MEDQMEEKDKTDSVDPNHIEINGSSLDNPDDGGSKTPGPLNSDEQGKVASRFIHRAVAELLGVRFLRNERKTFEQDVERSMHQLIQERLLRENNNPDPVPLPAITVDIPATIKDFVEFHIQTKDEDHLNALLNSVRETNAEFFENFKNEQRIKNLLASPIRILVGQLFLYRGQLDTPVERCLTLTTPFVPTQNRYQQCLVLCFESPAKVTEILNVFRKLPGIFNQHSSGVATGNAIAPAIPNQQQRLNECKVMMNADVEIQEEVQDGKWQTCPYDKDSFKLKAMLDKKIIITLCQDLTHYSYPVIRIERCFGILLSPGRNVSPNQMVAIGLNSLSNSIPYPESLPNLQQWQIVANWVPAELDFPHLNTETPRSNRVYFTIALDLILEHVDEPIRFVFEAKAKILPASVSTTEKLWKNLTTNLNSKNSRSLQECFSLIVRKRAGGETLGYEILSCLSSTQIAMQKQRLSLMLLDRSPAVESSTSGSSPTSPVPEEEIMGDDDEPLQSGSGSVNKECSQNELQAWQAIMEKWNRDNLTGRPKRLFGLVHRGGVPQPLRPEVWQLLAGAHEVEDKILPKYKLLVTQESLYESLIVRDISRTFTAHEKFRDAGAEQDALFRVCKAYSNYDAEIGYCQGMSYLVAALLLNMPEEQAFCVLVQIMYRYRLRDLFKSGLEQLHCKFYQLERLLDEQIPELYYHFVDLRIEAHMYASQWFLTLFTTKFPLNMVFMIIDLFLLDEMEVVLQIAICLLQMSKNDLLALDFEGIMKYFRVTLPKLYRTDEAARELIRRAVKINVKKAKKFEQQYREWREKNRDPLEILQTENKRLMQAVARLEQENDDLSQELLSVCHAKILMKQEVNRAEDKAETLNSVLLLTKTHLVNSEEDCRQLTDEIKNLKDMYRKEISRFEAEKQNDRKIIEEYKKICRNYQEKYEMCQQESQDKLEEISELVRPCSRCSDLVHKVVSSSATEEQTSDVPIGGDLQALTEDPVKQDLYRRICDLESELIKTKIALAESEDKNGQLVGKLYSTSSELNSLKAQNDERAATQSNTWFSKTLSSLRDAAAASNKQSSNIKPSLSVSQGISCTGAENTNGLDSQSPAAAASSSDRLTGFRRNSSQSDH